MNVEREVILDLLPLYAAGELSPQSRQLVEDHLAKDASLRRLAASLTKGETVDLGLQQLDRELDNLLELNLPSDPQQLEKRSFSRTRLLSSVRSALIGGAIFATLAIFSFWFDGNSVTFLAQSFPQVVRSLVPVAVVLWVSVLFSELIVNIVADLLGGSSKNR